VTAGKTSGVQTTINNNADNRVITGSGTANTLEAESSFTYDVSTNTALISSASSPRIKVTDTTNNCTTEILSVNSASQIGSISDHPLSIATNNVERVHVDTSGNVGIGSNAPESKLAIKGSSGQQDLFSISDTTVPTSGGEYGVMMIKTATTNRALNVTNYSTSGIGVKIYNNGGAAGRNVLECYQAGGTRFIVNEDVTVSTGNLVIGTSGKGIDFSATPNASNGSNINELLDYYEEGTWTPGIDRSALSMSGVTYSYSTGTYTRIGRLVTVWFDFNVTANGTSGSGVPYVTQLPFTALYGSGGGTNNGGYGAPTFRDTNLLQSGFRIYGSSSFIQDRQIYLYNYNSSGTQVVAALNSTGRISGQATYFAS